MKNGIKIMNLEAGEIFGYIKGIRGYYEKKNSVLSNSLLSRFLVANGLRVKNNFTKDVVNLSFEFGALSYEDELKKIDKLIKNETDTDKIARLTKVRENIVANKELYVKTTTDEIREEFYENGFTLDFYKNDKLDESIHYVMLYRSPAKAKLGNVIFINDKLYPKAIEWLRMGLELPRTNAKIVEMGAYSSLTSSSIVDTFTIDVDSILIVKDVDSFFKTNAKVVYTDENKQCRVRDEVREVKNTLWDGMALIDKDMINSGMALLRQHFFKACAFATDIQLFFKDYYGDKYDTATVKDMFGNDMLVKNIKMITTDNAIKWLKFSDLMGDNPYEYWKNRVRKDGCCFGICKQEHESKLGKYQQMSYQMINTLPATKEEIEELCKDSIDYINNIKKDNDLFIEFLKQRANYSNVNNMLVDLYNHNKEIANTDFFRDEKKDIINEYKKKLMRGKLLTNADNLTLVSNPYALLLYVVGESVENDTTLPVRDGVISVYTTRFTDGEYLAGFRSPHNSPNNVCYFLNTYSATMSRYFRFSNNIIAINSIHTDIQDRANGCDMDSDSMYVSNNKILVGCAKRCYNEYPTIVNDIEHSNKSYDNTMRDFALVDNTLQKSRAAIGLSSNLAQLAMSYYWSDTNDKDLYDNFVILSVLAQVSIDSSKRAFNVDLDGEIKRIMSMDCMKRDKPIFWNYIKKSSKKDGYDVDKTIVCPMNIVVDTLDKEIKKYRSNVKTVDITKMIIKVDGKAKKEQMDKIVAIVKGLSDYDIANANNDSDEYYLTMDMLSDEAIDKIANMSMNKKTVNRLIIKAFLDKEKGYSASKYRRKLLNVLYNSNKKRFLDNFVK